MREISFTAFSRLLNNIELVLHYQTNQAKDASRFFAYLDSIIVGLSGFEEDVSQDLMNGAESLTQLLGDPQFNPGQPNPELLSLVEKTCRHWESYFDSIGRDWPNARKAIQTEQDLDLVLINARSLMLSLIRPTIHHQTKEIAWIKLCIELLEYFKETRVAKTYTDTYYRLQWLVRELLITFFTEGVRLRLLNYDDLDSSRKEFKLSCEMAWRKLSD